MQRRRNSPELKPNDGSLCLNSITYDPRKDALTHGQINSLCWGEHQEEVELAEKVTSEGKLRKSGSFPLLKDIMVDDQEYINLLLGNASRHDGNVHIDNQPRGICAKICAGFSFVAILFLLFVGILVETQPLYVKGVEIQSQEQYDIHIVSKTAFKAAAAYFLVMVMSIIYAQNHEQFSCNIVEKIRKAIHLRQHFAVAYSTYRRRKYNHIPEDANSVAPDLPTIEDILNLGPRDVGAVQEEVVSDDQIPTFELWKKFHKLGNVMSSNLEKAKRR